MIPYGKKKRGSSKLHSHNKCKECSENVFSKNRGGFKRLAIEEGLAEMNEEQHFKELYEAALDVLQEVYQEACVFDGPPSCSQCRKEIKKMIKDQVNRNREKNKDKREDWEIVRDYCS